MVITWWSFLSVDNTSNRPEPRSLGFDRSPIAHSRSRPRRLLRWKPSLRPAACGACTVAKRRAFGRLRFLAVLLHSAERRLTGLDIVHGETCLPHRTGGTGRPVSSRFGGSLRCHASAISHFEDFGQDLLGHAVSVVCDDPLVGILHLRFARFELTDRRVESHGGHPAVRSR